MRVLYICRANVGRSQMAEAIFNNLQRKHFAVSAGLNPGEWEGKKIDSAKNVVICMKEIGFDLREKISKKITKEMTEKVDKIIVIGERNNYPSYLTKNPKVTYWNIPDAGGTDLEFHRKTRDKIMIKIKELIKTLK